MDKGKNGTPLLELPLRFVSRRRFTQSAGAAAIVTTLGTAGARAQDLPRVDESDPTAKALNYANNARSVDAAVRPSDRFCYNCQLFAGDSGDDWAKCSIFPGKLVAGEGWCSVWAPKQSEQ